MKDLNAWAGAEVSDPAGGGFGPVSRPEARSARVLAPPEQSAFRRDFDEKMEAIIKPLVRHVWRVDLKEHSETHLVRYAPGDYYVPHSDTGLHRGDRYFTAICYLNDDFTGGRTSFQQLNYSVTPRCGKAVVFPSTYLHCAEPVLSG